MAKRLDQILVIDLECTCWEDQPPAGEENEVIEIGVCALELKSLERLPQRSILVRPARSRVSPFCTQLTTLSQEQVDQGIPFAEACEILRKEYDAKKRPWASYGDFDRRHFERQCQAWSVPYPFGPTHLSVKNLVAIACGLSHEVGMAEALPRLGLPLEGTHHRGADDAWNIAGILQTLLRAARHGMNIPTPP
jgi:inhibitor of KinA sporulation pathway (predicted exonuclease)